MSLGQLFDTSAHTDFDSGQGDRSCEGVDGVVAAKFGRDDILNPGFSCGFDKLDLHFSVGRHM